MPGGEPSFWNDLRRSTAAWVRFPWLPVVSIALTAGAALSDGPGWPVSFLSLILTAGWVGTERICYLRAFRQGGIGLDELWRMTRAFIPRYATLGAVVGLLIVPASIALAVTTPAGHSADVDGFLLYANVVAFVIGVACTFIAPALAFSTRRVRDAARIGLRMIQSEWPASWAYLLIPPIVGLALVRAVGPWTDAAAGSRLVFLICAPLLNLWFKGAIVSYYLRRWETGDDGAAFIPRRAAAHSDPEPGDELAQ